MSVIPSMPGMRRSMSATSISTLALATCLAAASGSRNSETSYFVPSVSRQDSRMMGSSSTTTTRGSDRSGDMRPSLVVLFLLAGAEPRHTGLEACAAERAAGDSQGSLVLAQDGVRDGEAEPGAHA